MSVQGTGILAGVAQTGLQAQQLARKRAKRSSDRERAKQVLREIVELRLHGLGEDDDANESSSSIHTDAALPEHPRQGPPDSQSPPAYTDPSSPSGGQQLPPPPSQLDVEA